MLEAVENHSPNIIIVDELRYSFSSSFSSSFS